MPKMKPVLLKEREGLLTIETQEREKGESKVEAQHCWLKEVAALVWWTSFKRGWEVIGWESGDSFVQKREEREASLFCFLVLLREKASPHNHQLGMVAKPHNHQLEW